MSLQELHTAINDVDLSILNLDNAIALSSFAPEAEETEMVKEYAATNDATKLPRPEQFILEVRGRELAGMLLVPDHACRLQTCHASR